MYRIKFSDDDEVDMTDRFGGSIRTAQEHYGKVRIYSNSRRRWYILDYNNKGCVLLHVRNLEGITHILVPNDGDKFNDLFYFILGRLEDSWSMIPPQDNQKLRLVYYYYNEGGEIVQLHPNNDDNICQFFTSRGRKEMEVNILINDY